MAIILCDLGGTHARLCRYQSNKILEISKYKVASFKSLPDLLEKYLEKSPGRSQSHTLYLASAGYLATGDVWKAANLPWSINLKKLRQSFKKVEVVNDLFAVGSSLALLKSGHVHPLVRGKPHRHTHSIVMSAGTGSGLCYVHHQKESPRIFETLGAHMVFAHPDAAVQKILSPKGKPLIAEEVLAAPGLLKLYRLVGGKKYKTPEDVIQGAAKTKDKTAKIAIRMYQDLWAFYCHQAVLYSGFLGRVYLSGPIFQELIQSKLWDSKRFEKQFISQPKPVVAEALKAVSIHVIMHPHPELLGLSALGVGRKNLQKIEVGI